MIAIFMEVADNTVYQVGFASMELEELRSIALGEKGSELISRPKALDLLSGYDYSDKYLDLRTLLENSKESLSMKYFAAAALGKLNTPKSREILLSNIDMKDESLLSAIFTILGCIGDRQSLNTIMRIKDRLSGIPAARARFAVSLISYRLRLDGNEIPPPTEEDFLSVREDEDSLPIPITKGHEQEIKKCLKSITLRPFGIQVDERSVYQAQLGSNTYMLLLDSNIISTQSGVNTLLEKKALLGLVAKTSEETGNYFVAYLILCTPSRINLRELELVFARARGKLCFGGKAVVHRGRIVFYIRSFSKLGMFPLIIRGQVEDDTLKIIDSRYSVNIHSSNRARVLRWL